MDVPEGEHTAQSTLQPNIQSQIRSLIGESIADLTTNLSSVIDNKLFASQAQTSDVKCNPAGNIFPFKKAGNKKQFQHEARVLSTLQQADSALAVADMEKAKQLIQQGIVLVKRRIKLIKLADKSEYGWATVKEYESDELASDSEDEKRIYRSERRAEKRVRQWNSKRFKKNPTGFQNSRSVNSNRELVPGASGFTRTADFNTRSTSASSVRPRPIGPCFKISFN